MVRWNTASYPDMSHRAQTKQGYFPYQGHLPLLWWETIMRPFENWTHPAWTQGSTDNPPLPSLAHPETPPATLRGKLGHAESRKGASSVSRRLRIMAWPERKYNGFTQTPSSAFLSCDIRLQHSSHQSRPCKGRMSHHGVGVKCVHNTSS